MAFPSRTLRAVCEISSGTLQISQRPPAYTHEAGALSVVVDLKNDGAAYVPDASIVAGMYLFWPDTQYMSELVEMDIVGCTLSGTFGDALTAMPGCPLLVVQLQDTDTNDVIVAAAAPIQITKVEGSLIVTTRPPSPSEIIYVGRSPYINLDNYHWMQWDNSLRAYVDTGVVAKGPQGDPGPVATVCGVSPDAQGNVPLKGSDIPLQTMSLQTVAQAINDLGAVFTGATSQSAGVKGLVPAPAQGATGKILLSDGTWADPPTGSAIPTSSSDNTPIATSLSNLNDQIANLGNAIAIPRITGTTNNTGSTIGKNLFFWLNESLCVATADISNGAEFTSSNYMTVSTGGLNTLVSTKIVSITSTGRTFSPEIELYGPNYYVKCGRIIVLTVDLKINSSTIKSLAVSNYVTDPNDCPIFEVSVTAGNGVTDGLVQPFTIRSSGNLVLWNSKTGVTYCQGTIVYISKGL